VSAAIAKGYTGQTGALEKLIPGLSQAAKKSDDFNVIMGELAETTGGAMAESASTAAGQYQVFTNQMGELQESLGAGLLPVVQAILPLMQRMADFAAENTTAIKILVGIVAGLSAGILVANAAMKAYAAAQVVVKVATAAWTAAQWLLNAALTANPIGLVIAAIAALAAGLVIAYTKSETFRNIVNAAFAAVKAAAMALVGAFDSLVDAARTAFNWIVSHWKVGLFAFGPIGAAIYLIIQNFDKLEAVATRVFGAIQSAISGIAGAIESVAGAVRGLLDLIGRIRIPHIDLPGPFLAPVTSASPAGARGAGPGSSSSRSAGGVVVNVYGAVDPEGTARAIRRVLDSHDRRLRR
jgi:phage-related protein